MFLLTLLEKIIINTPGSRSEILVGEKWENIKDYLPERGVVIITDDNVRRLYGQQFPGFPVYSIQPGEVSKTLSSVERLAGRLLEDGIDRSGFILAIGGGVVSDLAGFLASVYMRGIRCGYVSTTLLSQVDASTGGKNGVNLGSIKNTLGIIRQPEFVICDPAMLATLPDDEFLSGLAEMIKTAIIGDRELFELIDLHYDKVMKRDTELLEILVSRSVSFKAAVVSEDENEKGLRRILNFGHTFGHAIELERSVKHGFAVAAGMRFAAAFSYELGLCSQEDMGRIIRILNKFGLPEHHDIPVGKMEQLILHDKKKAGEDIYFVFTCGIGNATYRKVPVGEVTDFYKRYRDKKQTL